MEESRRKLIIDGNALYELDLDCLEKRRQTAAPPREMMPKANQRAGKKRRQR